MLNNFFIIVRIQLMMHHHRKALSVMLAMTVRKLHGMSIVMCMCCSMIVAFGAMVLLPPLMFMSIMFY